MPERAQNNVGIAFALVIGAGLSTCVGAAVVFIPALAKLANRKVLASALGFSSGVMTYVSFVEIFGKSSDSFVEAGNADETSFTLATVCFFGGVMFMMILNYIVSTVLMGGHHHHGHPDDQNKDTDEMSDDDDESSTDENHHHQNHEDGQNSRNSKNQHQQHHNNHNNNHNNQERPLPHSIQVDRATGAGGGCPCHSKDPGAQLDAYKQMAVEMEEYEHQNRQPWAANIPELPDDDDHNGNGNGNDEEQQQRQQGQQPQSASGTSTNYDEETTSQGGGGRGSGKQDHKLMGMSVNTALAIALHNFPEGLATFVATLDDPGVGLMLAVAIAIHNIPEGLCVAMPIYYATGNRWKAFCWATMSGVSEPIAALVGWLILSGSFSPTLYGILFGMVTGMMIIISVRELLPTAHRYDPEDTVVTYSFVVGMAIMALSLVLFQL